MRIALVGAVEGSRVALDALLGAGFPPALLVTLPLEAGDRHSDFIDLASPARASGIDVHFTRNINATETVLAIQAARIDVTMVVGWSQICRKPFLRAARLGTLGFHPAPLPRFRGRAVIPWTILSGATWSGSTLFWLDEGVDSGAILAQRLFSVAPDETARSLYEKHKRSLAELVPLTVRRIASGDLGAIEQDEAQACYCAKRTPEDGLVDWRQPAEVIERLVRAVGDPYPGAFAFEAARRIRIDAARLHSAPGRHIGLVGQVQSHTADGFTVLCGDGATIEITAFVSDDNRKPKIHAKMTSF